MWCNGNTSDFGSEILGSSPSISTKFLKIILIFLTLA